MPGRRKASAGSQAAKESPEQATDSHKRPREPNSSSDEDLAKKVHPSTSPVGSPETEPKPVRGARERLALEAKHATSASTRNQDETSALVSDLRENAVTITKTDEAEKAHNAKSVHVTSKHSLAQLFNTVAQIASPDLIGLEASRGSLCVSDEIWLKFRDLKVLKLSKCKLEGSPGFIANLARSLAYLDLGNNSLGSIPDAIGQLTALVELRLSCNQLGSLPIEVSNLRNLRVLTLSNNWFSNYPQALEKLEKMEHLDLAHNSLRTIPKQIQGLQNLKHLDLEGNKVTDLPSQMGKLTRLEVLKLHSNWLRSLPVQLGNLSRLRELFVFKNSLASLEMIGRLESLATLDASENEITDLPATIGRLSRLEILKLDNNQIKEVPKEIGQLQSLVIFQVAENRLESLPEELKDLANLRYLDVRSNELMEVPLDVSQIDNRDFELCWEDNPGYE